MAKSVVTVRFALDQEPASVEDKLGTSGRDSTSVAQKLAQILTGPSRPRFTVQVDSATEPAATLAIALTQADFTAGDKIYFRIPDIGDFPLTAVAASATAADGEFVAETSDTVTGDNVEAACNQSRLGEYLTASNSSGTVTFTSNRLGAQGNAYQAFEEVTTATATDLSGLTSFSGGQNALDEQESVTVTVTDASLVDGTDTLTIGNVVLTAEATEATADASEDLFHITGTDNGTASELGAIINAHSVLSSYLIASVATNVVTIQPRSGTSPDLAATLADIAEAGSGLVLSTNKKFDGTITFASQVPLREYGTNR